MTILNYFFIGIVFTFIMDLFLNMKKIQKHPKMAKLLKRGDWNTQSRILCIIIWPLAFLAFFNALFKSFFK